MKTNKKGFTLIELMIVVAIIGILAAIAIPKFADLISKSKEGATKGELSTTRSALQIYYGDNEGWFPSGAAALDALLVNSKYLKAIPTAKLPRTGHADSAAVVYSITGTIVAPSDGTNGTWHYEANPSSAAIWGNFSVNCTHEDIRGQESASALPGWSTF